MGSRRKQRLLHFFIFLGFSTVFSFLWLHRRLLREMFFLISPPAPSFVSLDRQEPPPRETENLRKLGASIYRKHCASCHGQEGKGDGFCALFLNPKPRNFQTETFRTGPSDASHVFRAVTEGIPKTPMRSFAEDLTPVERWAVSFHVMQLRKDTPKNENLPTALGSPPLLTWDSVRLGKSLYEKMRCALCHGEQGSGDGPMAKTLPKPPADLRRQELFQRGTSFEQVAQTLWQGIPEVRMPPVAGSLSSDEAYALAVYVLSLSSTPSNFSSGAFSREEPQGFLAVSSEKPIPPDWTATGERPNENFGRRAAGIGDTNGDGFDDIVVGAPGFDFGRGKIAVFLGSAQGLSEKPFLILEGSSPGEQWGHQVGSAGDVNGDGFFDFFATSPSFGGGRGKVCVFAGGPKEPSSKPLWCYEPFQRMENFGDSTCFAGDVNGDGFSDLLVGAYGFDQARGKVHLFLGSPEGLSKEPVWVQSGEARHDQFGYSLSPAGDVNGDGYSDFVIGAKFSCDCVVEGENRPVSASAKGKAYLYFGSPTGRPVSVLTLSSPVKDGQFAYALAGGRDFDGDGFSDFLTGGPRLRQLVVFKGTPGRPVRWRVLWGKSFQLWRFGFTLGTLSDFTGDGSSELFVYGADPEGKSRVLVFNIQAHRPWWKEPVFWIRAKIAGGRLGSWCADAGDVNGDGFSDLLVCNEAFSKPNADSAGAVWTFYGRRIF